MLLLELDKALKSFGVKYAVAGGCAVALHGAVRGTVDVDLVLLVTKNNFLAAEKALASLNLRPRLPVTAADVFNFREEYVKRRNMVAWSFVNPSDPSQLVDVIITHDLKSMAVMRLPLGGASLPVLSVPDLIRMKRAAGRPQDLEDVKALESL